MGPRDLPVAIGRKAADAAPRQGARSPDLQPGSDASHTEGTVEMNRSIAWTDMSALPAQADRRQATQDPKLVERLVSWMTARIERRRAAELERLGWDLEARFERRG